MEERTSILRLGLALMAAILGGLLPMASAAELDDVRTQREGRPQYTNRSQPIETSVGQAFSISLPSGPHDHWRLAKPLDESILKLLDTHVEPAPAPYAQADATVRGQPPAGEIKSEVWTFTAVGEGTTEIDLVNVVLEQNDVPQGKPFLVTVTR